MLRVLAAAIIAIALTGCANEDEEAKKAGICIHGTTVTTKGANCSACAGTCATQYYTYCTDEKKADDCKNLSAACSTAAGDKEYDDVITFYDGGKKCNTNGYTVACSSNPKYFAADAAYCPP